MPEIRPPDEACLLCGKRHRLRAHGRYLRWAIVPEGDGFEARRIPVRRFLCAIKGRTLSLLPDFCTPRCHYGPEAVGVFLYAFAFLSLHLLDAFRKVRPEAVDHGTAWAIVRRFLEREVALLAYLSRLTLRARAPPEGLTGVRYQVACLLCRLFAENEPDPGQVLRRHGVRFHREFGLAIA